MRFRRKRQAELPSTASAQLEMRSDDGPIREFVYLDEVSVRSMLASIKGPLEVESTSTETRGSESIIEGTAGAGFGVSKAEIRAQQAAIRGSGNQVLRRTLIQADFRNLMDVTAARRLFRGDREGGSSEAESDAMQRLLELRAAGRAVADSELVRGALVELEIEVAVDPVYQASEVVGVMMDIIREDTKTFGVSNFDQISAGARMLTKILAGLVPVRCGLTSHVAVDVDDATWLVERSAVSDLKSLGAEIREVTVVGVAEADLFWKDPRRVLFSKSRYTALCRIGMEGLQPDWVPIKMSQMLQIGDVNIGALVTDAANTLVKGQATPLDEKTIGAGPYLGVLAEYAEGLSSLAGVEISVNTVTQLVAGGPPLTNETLIVEWFRDLVAPVESHAASLSGEIDPEALSEIRFRAVAALAEPSSHHRAVPSALASTDRADGCYLDSEFVAIYW